MESPSNKFNLIVIFHSSSSHHEGAEVHELVNPKIVAHDPRPCGVFAGRATVPGPHPVPPHVPTHEVASRPPQQGWAQDLQCMNRFAPKHAPNRVGWQ
jgi:hypothetical protein